jgi:C-terminal peptidase prc
LSRRISEISDRKQLAAIVDGMGAEMNRRKDFEHVLVAGLMDSLPGGGFWIDEEQGKVQGQLAANKYVGIGIALGMDQDEKRASIMTVIKNGPAWHAQAKPKDIILTIDGQSTEGKDLTEVVQELRGEEGSQFTMVVRQPDAKENRELKLTRGRVFIPTLEGTRKTPDEETVYTLDAAPEFALIRILQFGPSTLHELKQVEPQLRAENVRGIILDLRTGGGLLHDCVLVADALLSEGIIGHVRTPESKQTFNAGSGTLFEDLPMVVLVSRHSEASAVFLTAALQDLGRAVVVGEPTEGRKYVRSDVKVPGHEGQFRIATGVLERGDGTSLLGLDESQRLIPLIEAERPAAQKQKPTYIRPDHVSVFQPMRTEGQDALINIAVEILRKASGTAASAEKPLKVSG